MAKRTRKEGIQKFLLFPNSGHFPLENSKIQFELLARKGSREPSFRYVPSTFLAKNSLPIVPRQFLSLSYPLWDCPFNCPSNCPLRWFSEGRKWEVGWLGLLLGHPRDFCAYDLIGWATFRLLKCQEAEGEMKNWGKKGQRCERRRNIETWKTPLTLRGGFWANFWLTILGPLIEVIAIFAPNLSKTL